MVIIYDQARVQRNSVSRRYRFGNGKLVVRKKNVSRSDLQFGSDLGGPDQRKAFSTCLGINLLGKVINVEIVGSRVNLWFAIQLGTIKCIGSNYFIQRASLQKIMWISVFCSSLLSVKTKTAQSCLQRQRSPLSKKANYLWIIQRGTHSPCSVIRIRVVFFFWHAVYLLKNFTNMQSNQQH